MESLNGRIALVTGAAGGIGQAIAREFARNGASLALVDQSAGALDAVADVVEYESGVAPLCIECDVTESNQVDEAIDTCVQRFGSLDIMVNNAGIVRDATMRRMSVEDFLSVLHVNLLGTWLGTRAASLVMRDRDGGSIINVSSTSAKVGRVGQTNYSAAKAGIEGLTKAAAKELAPLNVRVNAVRPGLVETPLTASLTGQTLANKVDEIPMRRIGKPDDIAQAVLFLASDASSYVTGSIVQVSGGRDM
jgi:3-oxoacyl-[acyl-carrier protein] reductase